MSLAAGIAVPTAGYVWRIASEETALVTELGDDYRAFAERRKRLVPGIY